MLGRRVSENRPKIALFGPSSIHLLRLLGSQQHPQCGVLLTSFATWGSENSLAEINFVSTVWGGCGYIPILFFICVNRDFILCNWIKYTLFADAIIFCVFGSSQNPDTH